MFKFEPNEEVKAMVESLFTEKPKAQESNLVPGKRHRLKSTQVPDLSRKDEKKSVALAVKEIGSLVTAFQAFCHEIDDKVIASYLQLQIQELGDSIENMRELLTDDFDPAEMSESGLEYHEQARKIRAIILDELHQQYKKGN